MQLLKQLRLRHQPRKERSLGRRVGFLAPIGRMEQLETRSMLSASYGGAHYAPQLETVAAAWESGILMEQQIEAGGGISGDGRVANLVAPIYNDGPVDAGRFEPPLQVLIHGWQLPPPKVYIVTVYVSVPLTTTIYGGDLESSRNPSDADVPRPPLMATSPSQSPPANSAIDSVTEGVTGGPPPQPGWVQLNNRSSDGATTLARYTNGSAYNVADYSRLVAPTPTTSLTGEHSTSESLRARDTLFQDQASLDLLLVADSSVSDDDGAHHEVDGDRQRSSLDEQMDAIDTLGDSRWCDDVADSLGTLDRERVATDDVLTRFQELGPNGNEHTTDASRASQQIGPNYSDQYVVVVNEPVPARITNDQTSLNDQQGGMVLIQAIFDANSSAYDLAATVLIGEDRPTEMQITTEAAVGVYQVFDFGGAKLQTTNGKSAPRDNSVAIEEQTAGDHQGGA